jgi:hypothetical protein
MVDITYSIDADHKETIFSANTPAGENFLGGPEQVVPNEKVLAYLVLAQAVGLIVKPFP